METKQLKEALEKFLVDTRAERKGLSERAKRMQKVADNAYKLKRALDKLEELDKGSKDFHTYKRKRCRHRTI